VTFKFTKRLGKLSAVDSSSTETNDTLVLPQDIIDLWSLKCIRKTIGSIHTSFHKPGVLSGCVILRIETDEMN
jgi:hypothetical protein